MKIVKKIIKINIDLRTHLVVEVLDPLKPFY